MAGLILDALARARAAWSLPATLHLDAQEDPDPTESLRFRPAEELAPTLDEEAVRQYTDHLQGLSVGEVGRALTELFLHTPEVLTGKPGAIVRMLVPADSDRDRKPRSQAELMHTEHPDLVEAEQRAQGYRHLTVVHGASGEEALPPTEVTTLKVLLNMFAGSPPPYYIGYGADRVVLVVGGPHADRTTVMVEGLIRAISPKTRGGGMADPDWEITRRFSPGEHPPELYMSNDTQTSGEDDDTP